MRGLIQRDGKWVEPERIVGDVVPSYHWPALPPVPSNPVQPRGCVCPAGAEKTCAGPLCPRKPMRSAGAAA